MRSRLSLLLPALLPALLLPMLLLIAPFFGTAYAAGKGERPQEILSWRHQGLQQAEYERLAGAWESYATAHPGDVRALVEWGNALRYAGKRGQCQEKYQRAFELDSLDVAAVEAYASTVGMQSDEPAEARLAHDRMRRAWERDPHYSKLYYSLWFSALHQGDEALADTLLRMMVDSGDMTPPLLEYAYNMLEGTPPNAIVLTNGDNDTYPPLAYQLVTGRRHDVIIANLSLLNTTWYIRYLRAKGVPITLSDKEIDGLKYEKDHLIADQVVEHIAANLRKNPTRPLFYSVTVPPYNRHLAAGPCQGLLVPIIGGRLSKEEEEKAANENHCNWARTRDLIDAVYRTDEVLNPLIDWERESAVARLASNYVPLYFGVADWLVSTGKKDEAGLYYLRAIRFYAFQHKGDEARQMLDDWAKNDAGARLLPEARKLVEAMQDK